MSWRPHVRTAAVLAAGVLALAGGWYVYDGRSDVRSVDESTARWEKTIREVGPEAAWRELVDAAQLYGKGHFEAHHFGAALYSLYGMEKVGVCGDEFEYGCLHELYGRAIADKGLSALAEAREYCAGFEQEYSLCYHGIGHGLISYLGYEEPHMLESVSLCEQGTSSEDAGKCVAGALMEYLDRTMLDGEQGPFPVQQREPYAACASIPEGYSGLCVFELPRVWRKALWPGSATSTEAIRTTGELCDGLEERQRISCFGGAGSELYRLTKRDAEEALTLCANFRMYKGAERSCREQILRMKRLRDMNEAQR